MAKAKKKTTKKNKSGVGSKQTARDKVVNTATECMSQGMGYDQTTGKCKP